MSKASIAALPFASMATIAEAAYKDAEAHGLWDGKAYAVDDPRGMAYVRRAHVIRIREELCEAYEAAPHSDHFNEELADVVIMCMSTAGHLGIDLAGAIRRKMLTNAERPYGHRTA